MPGSVYFVDKKKFFIGHSAWDKVITKPSFVMDPNGLQRYKKSKSIRTRASGF
jgi:hypothetical protein